MIPHKIFSPGTEVQVQAPLVATPRFFAHVRGYHPGHYIILDNQKKDGTARPLEPGMRCTLRLLDRAQVYGFRTKVLLRTSLPVPLVFMEFPEEMEFLAVLKGKARQVFFDAVLSRHKLHGRTDADSEGLILNLTENGCLMESGELVDINSLLYLSFMLPEGGPIHDLPVKVKTCRTMAGRNHIVFNFLNAESAYLEKIRSYLKTLDELNFMTAFHRISPLESGEDAPDEIKALESENKKE